MKQSPEELGLWAKVHTLRAAILSYLAEGVPDSDERIVQARYQQRMVAEELVRKGYAKGIAFDREGDYQPEQKKLARDFDKIVTPRPRELEDADDGKPPAQIVQLDALSIRGETGELKAIDPPPSQMVGIDALKLEAKVSSFMGRELSTLEGTIGIDYVIDKDSESGVTFYVPLTGGKDDG